MKAKWFSCVLGLLCLPAEVILNTWKEVSQSPSTISSLWVNSSIEIKCTTSLEKPTGLSLKRRFARNEEILYLYFENGVVSNSREHAKFSERIRVTKEQPNQGFKYGFKLQLSLLQVDDTDLYYCSWFYINEVYSKVLLESNGTVIIVREGRPVEQCSDGAVDLTLISLCTVAIVAILSMFVCMTIVRCRTFKRRFTPCRPYAPPLPPRPPRPSRFNQPLQQHTVNHCPYMMPSTNDYGFIGNL